LTLRAFARITAFSAVSAFSVFAAVGCKPKGGAPPGSPAAAQELEPTSATVVGGRILLFLEYPHLVRGESARFLAHLSVVATGEPIRAGSVALTIGTTRLAVDAPKREGLFIPEGALPEAGRFPGRLVVESEQAAEFLDLGEIVVHETKDAARAAAEAQGEGPVGAVPFLMEQQWKVKLLLAKAAPHRLAHHLIVPAQSRLPEGAQAEIGAPLGGRLLAPPDGHLPSSGEEVQSGQVLGFVEPPLAAPDLAQLQALNLELDLKALEVVSAVTRTQTKLQFAERERERVTRLRERGLSTQQQLDEADRDLALARSEEASARTTKEALDRLLERRSSPALRIPLVSPLHGTVVSMGHVQGESVGGNEALFRVLDASRVWVEGRVSEFDLPLVKAASGGTATFAALPGERFDVARREGSAPFFLAPVVDAASRSVVIRCELAKPSPELRVGMLADLEVAIAEVDAAVAIPAEAVVMDQGTPTAYVMLDGELYQKRELELGIRDGGLVEVKRGLAAGEHVATRGAYVVKLAALSPASFGPGHQH
jgi:RND family efflux transporter MFP subunit